jgi:hypothetical protein
VEDATRWVAVGAALAMGMAGGCMTTHIGNTNKTCQEGEPCECEGIGNCLCAAEGCTDAADSPTVDAG